MLVLTRKQGEKILIEIAGETIEVVVEKTGAAKTKIGIAAPMRAKIMRPEIVNKRPGVAKPAQC